MDKIYIRDIALRCIIGIYDAEREQKQDVLISVCLHTDLRKAGMTDNFEDTVDYKAVKKRIVSLVEESRYYLVEALAESIAAACLEYDKVERVDVTVEKPGALRFTRTVAVEISREKQSM